MTEGSAVEVEDSAALAAFREALHDFADELNRLHISFGAPPYRDIVRASVRPKLSNAGIHEALLRGGPQAAPAARSGAPHAVAVNETVTPATTTRPVPRQQRIASASVTEQALS
ncbi:hypothetical protein ACIO93_42575 [Streptomyces sp. NPDC087903]|uniref:hypothetical protein n=1 Tax=Streptomyces sp. NPDC087903 TaxID=3365819 RepID=UPI00381F4CA0